MQSSIGNEYVNNAVTFIVKIPLFAMRPEVTCLFMFILFTATDSLIAFKSAILTSFGIYFITFLKLLYKDGRPFWLSAPIKGLICAFDFSGPAYHMFILTFFWCYNIIMYCMKYAESVNKGLVGLLFGLVAVMGGIVIYCGLYTGTIYMY